MIHGRRRTRSDTGADLHSTYAATNHSASDNPITKPNAVPKSPLSAFADTAITTSTTSTTRVRGVENDQGDPIHPAGNRMKLIAPTILLLLAYALLGCAGYERTYSLQYSDGKQSLSTSITLKPTSGLRK